MIPTAKKFIDDYEKKYIDGESPLIHMLRDFAKLHVEAQSKAILKMIDDDGEDFDPSDILKAYSLENIK